MKRAVAKPTSSSAGSRRVSTRSPRRSSESARIVSELKAYFSGMQDDALAARVNTRLLLNRMDRLLRKVRALSTVHSDG